MRCTLARDKATQTSNNFIKDPCFAREDDIETAGKVVLELLWVALNIAVAVQHVEHPCSLVPFPVPRTVEQESNPSKTNEKKYKNA